MRARSPEEAFDALAAHGEDARVLAGGQSLVPALNMRLLEPRLLVDINGLAALDGIAEVVDGLRLGALTRHAALAVSPLVRRLAPLLARAAPHIAHPAIRNRGTLGGSLAFADPAAELPACAVALDATLELASRRGLRRLPARDFFTGLYETALDRDELVVALLVPPPAPGTVCAFLEIARRRGDYALVAIAATARLAGGVLAAARIVFCGLGTRPVEAATAAAALLGGAPLDRVAAAQAALDADLDPPDDLNGPAAMKRHLARVLLGRALGALAAEAAGSA